ncbi:ATV_HP_G0103500.mRNA.1.CDS.1 [Saccharomyces cerevisiae]|nr:ATV_HP_G0103500.mRNA.1.CDS.1 [Saccharomyces cerevisiae]CAI6618306.1 ATV_HP_G0103500.mRNA.1.CDS.1 [Saccharomyces cerevisiae]
MMVLFGGKYWHDPALSMVNMPLTDFKGVAATLVTAAFAFGGSEFIAITTAEQSNPRKAIPGAAKQMIYKSYSILGYHYSTGLWCHTPDQLLPGSTGGGVLKPRHMSLLLHPYGVRVVPHFH